MLLRHSLLNVLSIKILLLSYCNLWLYPRTADCSFDNARRNKRTTTNQQKMNINLRQRVSLPALSRRSDVYDLVDSVLGSLMSSTSFIRYARKSLVVFGSNKATHVYCH